MGEIDFYDWIGVLMALLSLALPLCFARLFLGPTTPNRTVAFDTTALIAVGLLVLAAIRFEQPVLLDAAIITAVLGFLGTVMFAHFIEASPFEGEEDERE